ncbi:MAG: hypothetical protein QOI52_1291, partial [Chloroflexota bacterium]|nr:hypothetical protein [Chloroflexota bacterium]
ADGVSDDIRDAGPVVSDPSAAVPLDSDPGAG